MAIEYINANLPPSVKIEQLNQQTLELGGKESEGRFDKHELDNVYAQTDIGRRYNRRVLMGGAADDYTDWTHYYEQTGYSIWRCIISDYLHNTVNELYFSDSGTPAENIGALSSYEGEAISVADILTKLSMTSNEILARDWKWCYYAGYVYLTIRNSGATNYEGVYYVTSQSTAVRRQNFFVYNHQIVMNYESASYSPTPLMLAGLYVTDPDTTDGYGNPYIRYTGGRVLIGDTIYSIDGDYLLVELGTINYIFVDSDGIVDTNTTGWPEVCVPMAIVVCDESGILSITDQRTTINTMYADLFVEGDRRVYLNGYNSDVYFTYNATTGETELHNGNLTLIDAARVKVQIPIANANLGKGSSKATEVIIGNYNAWAFGINDDSVFTAHLPHDRASGTDVTVQIDWYIDEAGGDEIKWEISWSATPHNASEAIDAPAHTGSSDTGDIVIPAIVKAFTKNSLTIPGASLSTEDQLGITLKRIAITDGANPANEPAVVDIHIEYTKDKLGEAI